MSDPIEVGSVALTVSRHKTKLRTPTHFHRQPYACVVIEGCFTEESDGRQKLFEPGTAVFHPVLHEHADAFHTPTKCLNLTCSDASKHYSTSQKKTKRTYSWAKSIVAELELAEFNLISLEAKSLALLNELAPGRMPAWLSAAKQLTDTRFRRDLSVKILSESLDVHPVHFARSFKSELGIGFEGYLNSVRLKEAERLLLSTDDSVTHISYQCGFSEPSVLSRLFRARTGVTPRAFRSVS